MTIYIYTHYVCVYATYLGCFFEKDGEMSHSLLVAQNYIRLSKSGRSVDSVDVKISLEMSEMPRISQDVDQSGCEETRNWSKTSKTW